MESSYSISQTYILLVQTSDIAQVIDSESGEGISFEYPARQSAVIVFEPLRDLLQPSVISNSAYI
eukprot:m.1645292 g.1645292  ORF g.1645292 m.1645292 type:complete len:65 (+) comp66526_c0_seq1:95-289(+)